MEIVPSNSTENEDQPRGNRRCKRKRTSLNESKLASYSLRSSNTKAASASGGCLQAAPRSIGADGHFYECVKCNEVGSLICCDTCACTYHCQCLDPPLQSIPEGDWFCQNCSEDDNNLSDSTGNIKKRRRSLRRACKVVSSGCCLCSNINKKLIPDENEFFSFNTKSTAQSKLSNRGRPSSARNDDGVGSTIIQHNTNNNGDKRLVLRPRKGAETNQNATRKTCRRRVSSAQADEKDQNVNLHPRRRGRPPKNDEGVSTRSPQQNEQQQQQIIQKPELAMVLHGANLPPEYLEAIKAANEAAQRNASIKEIPWSGVELDALWVGVRRHGPDNWDTILEDPNLYILVLCKKTSPALSWRWQIELEKMHSILKTSGFLLPSPPPTALTHHEPLEHRQEPAISNEGGEGTPQHVLPPPPQIPVTSTKSGPLAPASAVIVSNGEEVGGEPVNQTPDPKAISDGEPVAQVLPPPKKSVTYTEFGFLIQNHQRSPSSCSVAAVVTVPNRGEAGGESVDQTPETAAILSDGEATSQEVLPQLQVPATSTESAPLVQNHQGSLSYCSVPLAVVVTVSNGEEGGEPIETNTQQLLLPEIPIASPESGASGPNHHPGTSSSLRDSPLIPVAEVISNREAAGGGRIEANGTDQKHLSVITSQPESGGALVVVGRNNDQREPSSSMIQRDCDVTVAVPPPRWRPNLNLHPMANHVLFEAFQQRAANLETQMMRDHMVGVVEEAAPGRSVYLAAQSPPANNSTTVRPANLFLGGLFPVRNQN